ncbi:MAG: CocE/NonD family hydrolase [Gammaproteobacteria bacterium]|jgi:putative CocE/NonD family hydrolase
MKKRFHTVLATWLLLAAAGTPLSAAADQPAPVANPPRVDVLVDRLIPLRDGVHLGATIWKPAHMTGPLPVVFVLTPYISDETHERAMKFARAGYVYVSVDVRGRGISEGRFEPLYGNGPDGVDVIKWLVAQPWCDGRVVMRGGSYRGTVQWQIMAEHPDHLVATVPTAPPYPGIDFPQSRGVPYSYMARWLALTGGRTMQNNLFDDAEYWLSQYKAVQAEKKPFVDLAPLAADHADIFKEWLAHPAYDAFWAKYNPKPADYRGIDIPVLNITGYFDGDQPGTLSYYKAYMSQVTKAQKDRTWFLIGPWGHHGTREPSQSMGPLKFGKNAVVDIDQLHIDWYNWLLGKGKKPDLIKDHVTYYLMGANEWRSAPSLDAMHDATLRFYLSSPTSPASDVFHSGVLQTDTPVGQAPDTYRYDPSVDIDPANYMEAMGDAFGLTRAPAHGANRLVYVSGPLQTATIVAGQMTFNANLEMDVPDTDIVAYVQAILPDGKMVYLGRDFIRARYRRGFGHPALVKPGRIESYTFHGFDITARRLPAGSRLRLIVKPQNTPAFQKNYNTGGRPGYEDPHKGRVAHVKLYLDPDHPSYLTVPVQRGAQDHA